ncbi:M48 family metalloprotease [Pseudomonadota bacterium]
MIRLSWALILVFSFLTGCATNPVTGKNELNFVSGARELEIGKQQYLPSRQMQGGDYNVDAELTKYVNQVGQRLAKVADRKLPYEFVVLNNSTPNAWALPGGKIAINRGLLLELENEAQLAAVLGHEVVHAAARHGAKSMERGMLMQGAVLVVGVAAASSDSGGGQLAVLGSQLAAGLMTQKYGRDAELESDYYGMKYMSLAGYDPKAAVELQQIFVRLSEGKNPNWLEGLFASHPPSQERVEANKVTVSEFPKGGRIGKEEYQRRIAHLVETKEAYENYVKGKEALGKGQQSEALNLAEQAIKIEPKEALFYGLRGDTRFKQEQFNKAVKNYSKALSLNDQFYYFYVRRGQTRQRLGDSAGARQDLESSMKLLPTAQASNALGNLYLAAGDRNSAVGYFSSAANSDTEVGREAYTSLVKIDLSENPSSYLELKWGIDNRRMMVIEVGNPTPIAVNQLQIKVSYPTQSGQYRTVNKYVRQRIGSRETRRFNLGIGPFDSRISNRDLSATLLRANIAR